MKVLYCYPYAKFTGLQAKHLKAVGVAKTPHSSNPQDYSPTLLLLNHAKMIKTTRSYGSSNLKLMALHVNGYTLISQRPKLIECYKRIVLINDHLVLGQVSIWS